MLREDHLRADRAARTPHRTRDRGQRRLLEVLDRIELRGPADILNSLPTLPSGPLARVSWVRCLAAAGFPPSGRSTACGSSDPSKRPANAVAPLCTDKASRPRPSSLIDPAVRAPSTWGEQYPAEAVRKPTSLLQPGGHAPTALGPTGTPPHAGRCVGLQRAVRCARPVAHVCLPAIGLVRPWTAQIAKSAVRQPAFRRTEDSVRRCRGRSRLEVL